jgi:3-methyladenine DNA glycosylase/8-oxoguanine DNA glycosylase
MATRLSIPAPRDYRLARDACSYGYFLLAPNHWEPESRTFSRVLDLAGGPAAVRIRQEERGRLRVRFDRGLTRIEKADATRQITRMLRLDEQPEVIRGFHRVDPRWKRSGRGRLFRSPSLFEDFIKTVTSCNVTWPSTITMNRRLCEVVGRGGAFPTPSRLARARATTLRSRCRVGYRDARIIELARLFASCKLDPAWFEDPATGDDAVHAALLELPGIGPYAAANIMQLLGRYSRLPLDSESIRHGKTVMGLSGSDRQVMRAVHEHFAPFGAHAFRSYWFELWEFYESKAGPSWTWVRERTASAFTASRL